MFFSIKKCDEWWCPKHSDFTEILQKVMLKNQFLYVVRKAKARFVYWQGETNKVIHIVIP